jgi:hypothetical protein
MVPWLVKAPVQRITAPLGTVRVTPASTVKDVNCRFEPSSVASAFATNAPAEPLP